MMLQAGGMPYHGKLTSCHARALAWALRPVAPSLPLWLMDVATTVPFGVRSVPSDKARRITCWRGTDEGLDAGVSILGLGQELAAGEDATRLLATWLEEGPVLLGPVDMGLLPYVPSAPLYRGLDHFIVAISADATSVHLCDPEFYPFVPLKRAALAAALRAEGVMERRRPNTMRRFRGAVRDDMAGLVADVLRAAAVNLAQAKEDDFGGAQAWRRLAVDGQSWCGVPGGSRALAHSLAAQMQRIAMVRSLLDLAAAEHSSIAIAASAAAESAADQAIVLGRLAGALLAGGQPDFCAASLLADREVALVPLFEEMADAVRL